MLRWSNWQDAHTEYWESRIPAEVLFFAIISSQFNLKYSVFKFHFFLKLFLWLFFLDNVKCQQSISNKYNISACIHIHFQVSRKFLFKKITITEDNTQQKSSSLILYCNRPFLFYRFRGFNWKKKYIVSWNLFY